VRSVGSAHFGLSAGVVCGGKEFEEEAAGIGAMALLVATPGRLLQVGCVCQRYEVLISPELFE
jgi:superfamily II DNA/RNA helicase